MRLILALLLFCAPLMAQYSSNNVEYEFFFAQLVDEVVVPDSMKFDDGDTLKVRWDHDSTSAPAFEPLLPNTGVTETVIVPNDTSLWANDVALFNYEFSLAAGHYEVRVRAKGADGTYTGYNPRSVVFEFLPDGTPNGCFNLAIFK